ncbi:unnamed protein product [Linum trigynum]
MRGGLVEEAENLFDEMPDRNVVTWNTMINGYFKNGQKEKAFGLLGSIPNPDIYTYNTMISGLVQSGDLFGARKVFDKMDSRDVVTWNSIIAGYVHKGMVDEAMQLFHEMPGMRGRDTVSWIVMVSGLAKEGRLVEAHELYEQMPLKDSHASNSMIAAYIRIGELGRAENLFHKAEQKDYDSWRQLINGLVTFGRLRDALSLYLEAPEKCHTTWNLLLLKLMENGAPKPVHALLEKLPYGDIVSWTNIIVGYFRAGEVGAAVSLFYSMRSLDVTLCNVMICGLGENDLKEEGVKLFMMMKESELSPDKATFTSILTICSELPALCLGEQVCAQSIKTALNHTIEVCNAMITMYARCGNMTSALRCFSSMPTHNVISWNSIISGFSHHGLGPQALEMFEEMRFSDVKPNELTFIAVLSACSHAGLVEKGKYYFDYMKDECFLQPTAGHYTCIVDLFGRFGLIDEAMSFIDQMRADGLEVPVSVWGAILGACRVHRNVEVGAVAAENVLAIEPNRSGTYMILAEIYASVGRLNEVERVLTRMKKNGVKKQPGCSWIEMNDGGSVFLSGDKSHLEFDRIVEPLEV